jgi:hypothetical protein
VERLNRALLDDWECKRRYTSKENRLSGWLRL